MPRHKIKNFKEMMHIVFSAKKRPWGTRLGPQEGDQPYKNLGKASIEVCHLFKFMRQVADNVIFYNEKLNDENSNVVERLSNQIILDYLYDLSDKLWFVQRSTLQEDFSINEDLAASAVIINGWYVLIPTTEPLGNCSTIIDKDGFPTRQVITSDGNPMDALLFTEPAEGKH